MDYKERKNIFPASEWFDINFLGGFLYSESHLKDQLNNQQYTINNEKLSSRVLNHWYETGIVTDDRPKGKGWKKFSFSEIVWIEVIIKLRKFGLDLPRIKKVKEQLDVYNTNHNKSKCPLIDFYVLIALSSKIPIKILVFESGEATIVRQIDLDLANTVGTITEDFISIDLNKLLNKLLINKDVSAEYLNYNVSNISKEVENSLFIDDVTSITIKVKDKDYIISQEFFTKDKIKANALISVLQFGELIERKNGGKSTFQITNKKKIKK